jgi:hypothetical protein
MHFLSDPRAIDHACIYVHSPAGRGTVPAGCDGGAGTEGEGGGVAVGARARRLERLRVGGGVARVSGLPKSPLPQYSGRPNASHAAAVLVGWALHVGVHRSAMQRGVRAFSLAVRASTY